MADITYSKPTWVDGSSVALSAANLQAISDAVDKICHLANRGGAVLEADKMASQLAAAFWYSSSGTGGSDGNGGQPPMGKATTIITGSLAQNATYDISVLGITGFYAIYAFQNTSAGRCSSFAFVSDGTVFATANQTNADVSISASTTNIRFTQLAAAAAALSVVIVRMGY